MYSYRKSLCLKKDQVCLFSPYHVPQQTESRMWISFTVEPKRERTSCSKPSIPLLRYDITSQGFFSFIKETRESWVTWLFVNPGRGNPVNATDHTPIEGWWYPCPAILKKDLEESTLEGAFFCSLGKKIWMCNFGQLNITYFWWYLWPSDYKTVPMKLAPRGHFTMSLFLFCLKRWPYEVSACVCVWACLCVCTYRHKSTHSSGNIRKAHALLWLFRYYAQ